MRSEGICHHHYSLFLLHKSPKLRYKHERFHSRFACNSSDRYRLLHNRDHYQVEIISRDHKNSNFYSSCDRLRCDFTCKNICDGPEIQYLHASDTFFIFRVCLNSCVCLLPRIHILDQNRIILHKPTKLHRCIRQDFHSGYFKPKRRWGLPNRCERKCSCW